MPHQRSEDGHNGQQQKRPSASAEAIAFTLLAGVVLGLLVGYGIDRLVGTMPLFTLGGVFVGFAFGLYAVYPRDQVRGGA